MKIKCLVYGCAAVHVGSVRDGHWSTVEEVFPMSKRWAGRNRRRWAPAAITVLLAAVVQAGCGTTAEIPESYTADRRPINAVLLSAPGVTLGDEIPLLDERTEKVVTHMTADGRVHLVAITPSGDARYLVVAPRGVEHTGRIGESGRYGYYSNLAIADDGRGRLHVVLRDEHWILEDGVWTLVGENRCALLIRAGDSLVCAQVVAGKELGTAPKWGITGFGGFGAGVVIPYRIRPDKLVLGAWGDHGWIYRAVIEQGSDYSTKIENYDDVIAAGDQRGAVHLFYRALLDRSATVRLAMLPPGPDPAPTVEWRLADGRNVMLADIGSASAGWFVPFGNLAFAVDPQSGIGAFLARHESGGQWLEGIVELRGQVSGSFSPAPVRESEGRALAAAGDMRFHALFSTGSRLHYLSHGTNGWSQPTRLGEFGTPSLFLIDHASIRLASDGRLRALAVWPRREGRLVGRWMELADPAQ
jgi:hypothetical protein